MRLPQIEIDGQTWTATTPAVICCGECGGTIACIPDDGDHKVSLDQVIALAASTTGKKIYLCHSTSMGLRPLIPHALGFLFQQGSLLGHCARHLRNHQVPACIDERLWHVAKRALLTAGSVSCRLHCGDATGHRGVDQAQYSRQLEHYGVQLGKHRMVLPVYDVARKTTWPANSAPNNRLGEKSLAVNALRVQGMPGPRTLILTNFEGYRAPLHEDLPFASLCRRVFPMFEHEAGCTLMVRASPSSDDAGRIAWHGLFSTSAVDSLGKLSDAIHQQVRQGQALGANHVGFGLSVILQERVAAPLQGILGTESPWDDEAEGMVAEFTINPSDRQKLPYRAPIFLNNLTVSPEDGMVRRIVQQLWEQGPSIAATGLLQTLAHLVADARVLRDRYLVPLEIEFVITAERRYALLQFRPLFQP